MNEPFWTCPDPVRDNSSPEAWKLKSRQRARSECGGSLSNLCRKLSRSSKDLTAGKGINLFRRSFSTRFISPLYTVSLKTHDFSHSDLQDLSDFASDHRSISRTASFVSLFRFKAYNQILIKHSEFYHIWTYLLSSSISSIDLVLRDDNGAPSSSRSRPDSLASGPFAEGGRSIGSSKGSWDLETR